MIALLTVHYQIDQILEYEMGAAYEGEEKFIFRVLVGKLGRKDSTCQT